MVRKLLSGIEEEETIGTEVVLFIFFGLLLGTVIRHIAQRVKLPFPYTVMLLFAGWIWGILEFSSKQSHPGVIGDSIQTVSKINPFLLFQIFLPALIFESSFSVNFHIIFREFGQALLLAGPGVVISTILTAMVPLYVFNYDWNWDTALMFGSILAATDPVAVVALLRELGASKRLATLIEAESLLNDGTAFVFYSILLERVVGEERSVGGIFGFFFQLSFGGIAMGIVFGVVASFWISKVFNDALIETSITIFAAYLVFWVSEEIQVSGVLAVVFLGLALSRAKAVVSPDIEQSLHHVWEMISFAANTLIFLLAGAIVAEKMFGKDITWEDFGFLFVLYIFLHLIRGVTVVLLSPLMSRWGYGLDWKDASILVYGGLRGAVGLTLALITELETEIDERDRDLIIFHTSGIVFLTLLINGTTTKHLLHFLGMDMASPASDLLFRKTVSHLRHETSVLVRALKQNENFGGADWVSLRTALPDFAALIETEKYREADMIPGLVEFDEVPKFSLDRAMTYSVQENLISLEIKHRFLSAMKASYWRQFEEGLSTSRAVSILTEAVELALDSDDIAAQWRSIKPHFHVPYWLKRMYSSAVFTPLTRQLLVSRLSLAVELVTSFLSASEMIEEIINTRLPEFAEVRACEEVKNEIYVYRQQAIQSWLDVRNSYPEVYRSIQSRHATEYILHHQKRIIKNLFEDGLLEEKELQKMNLLVSKHIFNLRSRPHQFNLPPQEAILMDLPFLQHLSEKAKQELLPFCERKIYEKGDVIFERSERSKGFFVVTRGFVNISVDKHVMETAGSGTILGIWALLSNELYFANAEAQTYVELFRIEKSKFLRFVRDHEETEEHLWRVACASMIKFYFMDKFVGYAPFEITKLCIDAKYLAPQPKQGLALETVAFLLHGSVTYGPRKRVLNAPVLLLPSRYDYFFKDNPRLLVFSVSITSRFQSTTGKDTFLRRNHIDTYLSHYHSTKLEILRRRALSQKLMKISSSHNDLCAIPSSLKEEKETSATDESITREGTDLFTNVPSDVREVVNDEEFSFRSIESSDAELAPVRIKVKMDPKNRI